MFNFFSNKKQLNTISQKLYEYILNSSLIFATLVTSKIKADYTDNELKDFLTDYDKKNDGTHGEYVLKNKIAFERTTLLIQMLDRFFLPKLEKKNADYLYNEITEKLVMDYAKRFLPVYEADAMGIYELLRNQLNEDVIEYYKSAAGVNDTIGIIIKYGDFFAVQIKKIEKKNLEAYGTKEEQKKFDENWLTDLVEIKKHNSRKEMEDMSIFSAALNGIG